MNQSSNQTQSFRWAVWMTMAVTVLSAMLVATLVGGALWYELNRALNDARQELVVDSHWEVDLRSRVLRLLDPSTIPSESTMLRPLFEEPKTHEDYGKWVHAGAQGIHARLVYGPRTPGVDAEVNALTSEATALSDLANNAYADANHQGLERFTLANELRYQQRMSHAVRLLEEANTLITKDEIIRSHPSFPSDTKPSRPTPTNPGETP